MRTTAFVSLLARLLSGAALLSLAACDRTTKLDFDAPSQTHSIAELKSRCHGSSTPITEPIIVCGLITGNDRYGEQQKTLLIEDASGAIAIAADHTRLADLYPLGAKLTVYCSGLVLSDYGGKVGLGAHSELDFGAGRIPQAELSRYLRPEATNEARPLPRRLTFADLSVQHMDCYVRFDQVHFAEQAAWCDLDPLTGKPIDTERLLVDAQGRTLPVRTLGTCTYAKELVPKGTGSICGVVDYFNRKYTLRITNRETTFVKAATSPTAYP